jgi:hypothetical protein
VRTEKVKTRSLKGEGCGTRHLSQIIKNVLMGFSLLLLWQIENPTQVSYPGAPYRGYLKLLEL